MGKKLIIRDADFSENAVNSVPVDTLSVFNWTLLYTSNSDYNKGFWSLGANQYYDTLRRKVALFDVSSYVGKNYTLRYDLQRTLLADGYYVAFISDLPSGFDKSLLQLNPTTISFWPIDSVLVSTVGAVSDEIIPNSKATGTIPAGAKYLVLSVPYNGGTAEPTNPWSEKFGLVVY